MRLVDQTLPIEFRTRLSLAAASGYRLSSRTISASKPLFSTLLRMSSSFSTELTVRLLRATEITAPFRIRSRVDKPALRHWVTSSTKIERSVATPPWPASSLRSQDGQYVPSERLRRILPRGSRAFGRNLAAVLLRSADARLFVAERGSWGNDEFNVVRRGSNYGMSRAQGPGHGQRHPVATAFGPPKLHTFGYRARPGSADGRRAAKLWHAQAC